MNKFFNVALLAAIFIPFAHAKADCVSPQSQVELSGTVAKHVFYHAGNGERIEATVLKLAQPLCVNADGGEKVSVGTLQLLPEDFQSYVSFTIGEKITLKGKLQYPGDTAWYTSFYILAYPASLRR